MILFVASVSLALWANSATTYLFKLSGSSFEKAVSSGKKKPREESLRGALEFNRNVLAKRAELIRYSALCLSAAVFVVFLIVSAFLFVH